MEAELPQSYPVHPLIDLPVDRLFNITHAIPPRCMSIGQQWCTYYGWTALHESRQSMIMFSEDYLDFDENERQGHRPTTQTFEFGIPLERAAMIYDRITSTEPPTHPNLQRYYGTTGDGFHKYEIIVGPLYLAADKLVNKLGVQIPNFLL